MGLGFRDYSKGSGIRVQGSGLRAYGSGFKVQGSGFGASGSCSRVALHVVILKIWTGNSETYLNPEPLPQILNPTPYTLHPTPYTLNPKP